MNKLEKLIAKVCPNGVEYKSLGEIAVINRGVRVVRAQLREGGKYPVYQNSITPLGFHTESNCNANTAFVIAAGAAGVVGYSDVPFWAADDCYYISPQEGLDDRFVYYCLMSKQNSLSSKVRKAGVPRLARHFVESIEIPLPPLAVQEEIVRMLDGMAGLISELEQELAARRQQYEWSRDKLLKNATICPIGVDHRPLGDLLDYVQPTKYIVRSTEYDDSYTTPVLTAGQTFILGYTDEKTGHYPATKDAPVIIFDDFTTATQWVDFQFKVKSSAMKILTIRDAKISDLRYVYYAIQGIKYTPGEHARQWIKKYSNFEIPLPPLAMQKEIVRKLDGLTGLIDELEHERDARKKQYEFYRDRLLTFERAG